MKNKFRILVRKFDPFEKIVAKFWDKYQKSTGCNLELDLAPMDLPQLHDNILTGGFDVAHVNTDWLTQAWELNVLENLKPYIEETPPDEYPDGWPESLLKLQTFKDGIAGLPFHDGPECLMYRKDLFESALEKENYYTRFGEALKPPQTWQAFSKVAEFFNRPQQGIYGTLFALYPDGHNNIFDFALQVWSRGGVLEDDQGNIILNAPQTIAAMTFYRSLINSPVVHPKSRDVESIGACWLFAQGEVAMMVNWFGFATLCETVEGSTTKGKVDICAVPHSEKCLDPVSLNVYYTWSLSTKSDHKDIAYDFIRFCVSKENDRILPLEGGIGCRKSTWFDQEVNTIIPYYSRMEELHRYANVLPRTPVWNEISKVIDDLVLEVINTEKPIKQILDEAQEKVRLINTGD